MLDMVLERARHASPLHMTKLSLKEKILLAVVLGVDKRETVPYGELSFPFAPQISLDVLGSWVFCERSVFYSTTSRMVKENLIAINNGVVKLTDNGKNILARNFPYLFLKKEKWDGFWRIIVFDIKEAERYKRDKLRNYLIKIKYVPISDGVWVTHHSVHHFIFDGMGESIIYIEGKLQQNEIDKILLKHDMFSINVEYGRLCTALKRARDLHKNDTIPLLRSQFLEIFANDPQMPLELLPKDWVGEKAKRIFLKS